MIEEKVRSSCTSWYPVDLSSCTMLNKFSKETDTEIRMFTNRFLIFLYLFSLPVCSLSSGQSGTKPEIYLFYDGEGGYHAGVVNYATHIRWPFGSTSDELEKNIHFFLYTRSMKTQEELFIGDSVGLHRSTFNKTLPTKIIIHGFTNSDTIGFPPAAKQTFLENTKAPPCNLIVVDWGKLAEAPWYERAAKNTRLVGVKVAKFIEFLVTEGSSLDQIDLIGHSLGSHVAGFAGSNLNNMTLSRITALDPALPLFAGASDENRIDPSDSFCVQVIHTAGGDPSESERALAFLQPLGHADYYVNGGRRQPGCGLDLFGACSHVRAYEFYLESVVNPTGFPSCQCENWEEYSTGVCNCSVTSYMGDQCSSSSKGKFFLRTRSKRPFAFYDRKA